jgi:hypothetical protein
MQARTVLAGVALLSVSLPIQAQVVEGPLFRPIEGSGEPQTFHERFKDYTLCTFGPQTLLIPALWASLEMADPPRAYPREWRTGVGAFGRNYGNAFAWRTSLESARFLTGALLHEDFRYRRSTSHNPLIRTFHAVAFTFVDKSDSGRNRIAFANVAGATASGFVGNLYLPSGFNDMHHAENRVAMAFAGLVAKNLLREFIPARLKSPHGWSAAVDRYAVPQWWTK